MSTNFLALLPFLAALQRKQSSPSSQDQDAGNPPNNPYALDAQGDSVDDIASGMRAGAPNQSQAQNDQSMQQPGAPSYDSTEAKANGRTVTLTRLQYDEDPNMGGTETTETRTGNHPFRDNNPGDIGYGKTARSHGAVGQDGKVAIFPNSDAGFEALGELLTGPLYRNLSMDDAIAQYAPPSENDTAAYQAAVRRAVGVSGDTLMSSLTPDQLQSMKQVIARVEGFNQPGTVTKSRKMIPNYP